MTKENENKNTEKPRTLEILIFCSREFDRLCGFIEDRKEMHHNIYSVKYVQDDCCFEAFTLLVL